MTSKECKICRGPRKATTPTNGFTRAAATSLTIDLCSDLPFALQTGFSKTNLAIKFDAYSARALKRSLCLGFCLLAKANAQARNICAAFLKAFNALGVAKAAFLGLLKSAYRVSCAALSTPSTSSSGSSPTTGALHLLA